MFAGSNPGSAMLLHVSDELSRKEKYAGGLSRSGASPYQKNIEDEDDDEDEDDSSWAQTALSLSAFLTR
jgi:hypothetical protein